MTEPGQRCGNCRWWGGSVHQARCAPCLHPMDIAMGERGYRRLARGQMDWCQGWQAKHGPEAASEPRDGVLGLDP